MDFRFFIKFLNKSFKIRDTISPNSYIHDLDQVVLWLLLKA